MLRNVEKVYKEGDMEYTRRQLKSVLYGLAVADALGVPYEFKMRGAFHCGTMVGHGTHDQPAGTWSDDTAMALATLDSLLDHDGDVDSDDLLHRYRDWLYDGEYTPDNSVFDVGGTCLMAIRTGRGLSGERDNGNGSLMRIAPAAFFDISDDDIRRISAVTHAHPMSCEACVLYVHVLRHLLDGVPPRDAVAQEYGRIWENPEDEISSSGFVRHTLEASLWCLTTTENYRDCVLRAVNLGGDTDTTACVAGALAGAAYGFEAIPRDWVETLRGSTQLDAMAERYRL